jgi:hypothetical protein
VNNKEQNVSKGIWVIYHKDSTQILRIRTHNGNTTEWYYGESAAKAALTRYHKKWLVEQNILVSNDGPMFDYGIADRDHYHKHIEKQVKRKNLMTGKEYEESVNTPLYMSPASETYWSM